MLVWRFLFYIFTVRPTESSPAYVCYASVIDSQSGTWHPRPTQTGAAPPPLQHTQNTHSRRHNCEPGLLITWSWRTVRNESALGVGGGPRAQQKFLNLQNYYQEDNKVFKEPADVTEWREGQMTNWCVCGRSRRSDSRAKWKLKITIFIPKMFKLFIRL